ncbi:Phage antirepressor protein KilAC domain protein [compost metagenome]
MAMSYSYGLQAKVFDRMTALEQQLPQAVSALPDFSNPAAAARAWAEQFEQREQLKLENQAQTAALALAAPKVEYVDRYVAADTGSMGVREVAKVLGAKMNAFTGFLLAHFMHRTTPHGPLTPNAEHIHNGRFQAKTGIAEHTNSAHAYVHYKFTAKGVAWISGEWGKHQAKLAKKQETRHG